MTGVACTPPTGARPDCAEPPASPETGARPGRRVRAWRRKVPAVLVPLLLAAPAWSYARALATPGSAPISSRTIDWLRDHGGASLVDRAEGWYYTRHPPSTRLSVQPGFVLPAPPAPAAAKAGASPTGGSLPPPTDMAPVAAGILPGEGRWEPVARTVSGHPTLLATSYRPDPAHPGVVVAAVWIDTTVVRSTLVAGTTIPGGSGWPWGATIPLGQRGGLLAAFNSGFRFRDTAGGFYADGRQAIPLVAGQASLIIHADGSATVGEWGRDAHMTPDIQAVRQNLKLIVDGGRPVAVLAANPGGAFGAPGQPSQYTWRSGLGVEADGALVYAAGKDLNLIMLADALADAGAVRAMQLDIHTNSVTFNLFQPSPAPAGVTGTKLLPDMARPATRYLQPDQRDFIALTVK